MVSDSRMICLMEGSGHSAVRGTLPVLA